MTRSEWAAMVGMIVTAMFLIGLLVNVGATKHGEKGEACRGKGGVLVRGDNGYICIKGEVVL